MGSLNEQAYQYLKQMITSGALDSSKVYSETRLARQLGMSRTPFRDAIQKLEQDRYIDIIPSTGFRIHRLTEKDVIETFQTRSSIEGYASYMLTKEYESPQAKILFLELENMISHMKLIHEQAKDDFNPSIPAFFNYDRKFHEAVIGYLGNAYLTNLFEGLIYQISRMAYLSLSHPGRPATTIREHEAILQTMRAGDLEHIYQRVLEHMDTPSRINMEDIHQVN
ncbi:GntR family transcriptional regulator [uncultured Eubacterium sp.]|uniref:GntR family transcriptional regulator n=1 Tax=uncultured Eubacterium sp. TaxID=165185 RepID=UPI0025991169|nr:GntR family transcriptional regulator [uncultured Eubacterium sp.]